MKFCKNCDNTARAGETYCGPCQSAIDAAAERDQLFQDMGEAIQRLGEGTAGRLACEAIAAVLKNLDGRY